MWVAGVIIAAFMVTVLVGFTAGALQPPSHVETIDPTKGFGDPRFAPRGGTPPPGGLGAPGCPRRGVPPPGGGFGVPGMGMPFASTPAEFHAPAGKPVTFR